MKRNIRVISLCLLLALMLSVFGIFAAFAEDAASTEEYGTTVFSLDSLTSNKITKILKGTNKDNVSFTKIEKNGSAYWQYAIPDKDKAASYLELSGLFDPLINIGTATDADGNDVDDPTQKKDTDFMVIDFDLSTDTTLIENLYFETSWYNNDYNHTGRVGNTSLYFDLDGADTDTFTVGLKSKAATAYTYMPYTDEKWVDVTFVYDLRDTSKTVVYFYINGIYSGKTAAINISTAKRLYFIRLTTAAQSLPDTTTNFANFTIKKFDVGYDGPLTDLNTGIGHTGATLDTMADLEYCLLDKPCEEQTKLATVTRGEDSFDVYEFSELDANLEDGDTVTLYKNVPYSLVVPKNANITFKDNAGKTLTPGTRAAGDLVGLASVTSVDYSAVKYVTRDRKTMGSVTPLTDADFATAFDGGNKVYTLLSDTAATFASEGARAEFPLIDLNGHTLTLSTTRDGDNKSALAGGANITVANGSLCFLGGADAFSLSDASADAPLLVFENLDEIRTKTGSTTFLDVYGGAVIFKDCKLVREPVEYSSDNKQYACATVASVKSDYQRAARIFVEGCELINDLTSNPTPEGYTLISNSAFNLLNSDNAGQNSKLTFTNSKMDLGADSFIEVVGYTALDSTDAAGNTYNDHKIKIELRNTDIISTNDCITTSLETATEANSMRFDLDLTVDSCDIKGASLLNRSNSLSYDLAVNTDYTYDVKVDILNECKLDVSKDAIHTVTGVLFGYEKLSVTLDGEIALSRENITDDSKGSSYTIKAPWIILPRSNPDALGYAITAANNAEAYPYIVGDHEYEFYWYKGDEVSVDKIPVELPKTSKYFSYKWAGPNTDGAFYAEVTEAVPVKANVTLYSDFTFNIYLPSDLGAKSYDTLTVNGEDAELQLVAIDGVEYMKITVRDINPANAADDLKIVFEVIDGDIEMKVAKEISVVDYLRCALNNAKDDTEARLIVSMINYVDKAYRYVCEDDTALPKSLTDLTASDKYKSYTLEKTTELTAVSTVGSLGVFDSVWLSLDNEVRFTFKTKAEFEGNLVFTYIKNGKKFVETKRAIGEREISIKLKANELLQNITVSYGNVRGEYNLAAYLKFAESTEDAELIALVDALWLYADYAKAYVAAKS